MKTCLLFFLLYVFSMQRLKRRWSHCATFITLMLNICIKNIVFRFDPIDIYFLFLEMKIELSSTESFRGAKVNDNFSQ